MRILHVGFGFRPWIDNGLLAYSEAVMDAQVRQGHDVAYFFPARQLPLIRRPFLHEWERGGVRMYEWVNSGLIVGRHRGTPRPGDDVDHAPSEAAFSRVLRCFAPELIHVQDLGGVPSSILDIAIGTGAPTVMTIHDYQPLCPTVKLYDAHDQICLRPDPGAMCAVCCADAPPDNHTELARTLWYARQQVRAALPALDAALRRPRGRRLSRAGARMTDRAGGLKGREAGPGAPGRDVLADPPRARARPPRAPAEAYQRRRDVNLVRLNRVDALIASSRRSAAIYRELGVTRPPVEIVPINPRHIERLRPKPPGPPGSPLRFVALNACASRQKGADLIVQALTELSRRGLEDRFRLLVYGSVASHVQPALEAHGSVELRGHYAAEELDALLDEADVGLFPSVWEEVYGFVALELLAKGVPVIGNAVGAIPDHVRPGETGWLNQSRGASELAELMAQAIEHPAEVQRLSESLARMRDELAEPFDTSVARLEGLYQQLLARSDRS